MEDFKDNLESEKMSEKASDIGKFVREAVEELLVKTGNAINNVAFVVEDEPRRGKEGETFIKRNEVLLGLYEGVPKTKRGLGYFGVLPDKITIFRRPLEEMARGDKDKLKRIVFNVVWHEVGHHLGFGEKEIRELEKKRKQNPIK